jgi:hypothetical protein
MTVDLQRIFARVLDAAQVGTAVVRLFVTRFIFRTT